VKVRDLNKLGWNPILTTGDLGKLYSGTVPDDIAAEQAEVSWADVLVFIYPIWWFERPAILKGWFDKVFSHGFAYRQTNEGTVEGLLKGKKAVVITTSGANEDNMRQNGVLDAIKTCMLQGTLGFSGIQEIVYENLYAVPAVSDEERKGMLDKVKSIFEKL
ncbi:MAG TPA: NAD(P)H-dependent oxidoreductase, partial [Desulfobacteria bacterium]|nr:NAD(P)H-dependent oxidoreductase [Desulfobacteria bacterium]